MCIFIMYRNVREIIYKQIPCLSYLNFGKHISQYMINLYKHECIINNCFICNGRQDNILLLLFVAYDAYLLTIYPFSIYHFISLHYFAFSLTLYHTNSVHKYAKYNVITSINDIIVLYVMEVTYYLVIWLLLLYVILVVITSLIHLI